MYMINTDASIEPYQPGGLLAWAYIVKLKGKKIDEKVKIHGWGKEMTNNIGEYLAAVGAVYWLINLPKEKCFPAIINSDSKLVVNQCNGNWNCDAPELIKLNKLIQKAKLQYSRNIKFRWIPREKNEEADALSRSLYTEKALQLMRDRKYDILYDGDDLPF